jgi:hypothetical protein
VLYDPHLHFSVYKLNRAQEISQFSPQMLLVMLRILNLCVLEFYVVSVCGLISLNLWLFLWLLICGFVQVLFLCLMVNFLLFDSHFPVLTLGRDMF